MITGYNTDVRHNDVVYHVQTEDKGLSNPFIESLLYVGGQILANKRTSYAELLAEGKGERAVMALMDHQHRTMIAAIRAGKFERRLASFRGGPAPAAEPEPAEPVAVAAPAAPPPERIAEPPAAADETVNAASSAGFAAILAPTPPRETVAERTLDQVILDYLTTEAQQDQLVLTLDGETDLESGQASRVRVRASSSRTGQPLAGVKIVAKLISTVSGPLTLAGGETDGAGELALDLDIPEVGRGTAALIVTGASGIGRSELKHLL